MTQDPLSEEALRAALGEEPLSPPSDQAREQALAAALAAFDREVEKKSQGFPGRLRLTHQVKQFFNLMGAWNMNQKTLAAAATAALGMLLTLAVLHQSGNKQDSYSFTNLSEEPIPTPARLPSPVSEKKAKGQTPETPADKRTLTEAPREEPADLPILEDEQKPRDEEQLYLSAPGKPVAPPTPGAAPPAMAQAMPSPDDYSPQVGMTGGRLAEPAPSSTAVLPTAPAPASMERAKGDAAPLAKILPPKKEHLPTLPQPSLEERDQFPTVDANPVRVTAEEPVSTFSVDVDTASYGFVRKTLNQGHLPTPDAVRVEEMINYFDYDYATSKDPNQPFEATTTIHPTPWNKQTKLLHIGIKGYDIKSARPRANLVFLLDVSGSMNEPDKLPLLKQSLRLLVESLESEDTVAVVVYAGAAGMVLPPTPAKEKFKILAALDQLEAGGSTAGGQGIQLAYSLAQSHFDAKAVNRVILATDGDFNVGVADPRALRAMVAEKRQTGIFLSVLGFGRGNYNDRLMQELAQNGNGQAAYIDTLNEARKVLVEEAASTLFPIAKDVKIQVEFNPNRVAEYRLIGYETRMLAREDFKNDRVDAGEIGSGHTVTALYEIVPTGSVGRMVEPLRYRHEPKQEGGGDEWAFLKIRYKLPKEDESRLITRPITDAQIVKDPSDDLRFAAAVAAMGQRLQGGKHLGNFGFSEIIELARQAKGEDPMGLRAEFVELARMAKTLAGR